MRCPTCHVEFDPAASGAMPFCSERCKRIDLKRWLGEEISIPYNEDSEGLPPPREPAEPDDD
jgi:endogenous inhibitor of DNA gyrase (YacG/DUF329 family)